MWLSRRVVKAFACVLCGLLFVGLSCDGNGDGATQPTITLKAVDCLKDDIKLSATVTKLKDASRTTTKVTIEVTCMGEALESGELNVSFWGLFSKTVKIEKGKATASQVTSLDTRGLKVTVTIEGSDGQKDVVVEVPEK